MADSDSIKLCECGCGLPAPIAKMTRGARGQIKGQPIRFRRGHKASQKAHGHVNTLAYKTWSRMLGRCRNQKDQKWPRYGGRGIKVCERWLKFENFLADMGERPKGTTIERLDNDGDYSPDNCKWASPLEQSQNTSNTVFVEHEGRRLCLSEWERVLGIYHGALSRRLKLGLKPPELFHKRPPRTVS